MFSSIIQYFQTLEHHPLQRAAILVGGMVLLWMLETAIPFMALQYKKNKAKHAMVNLSFTLIHLLIHTVFAIIILTLGDWCAQHEFGLVHWLHTGTATTILVSVLCIDFFVGWLVHFTEHKIKWMWHFHVIHHADNNVDVTTGLRHHPGESIFRGLFMLMGVLLAGAPMYAVMMYQTFLVAMTQFSHANIRLPRKLDKLISYIIVSPNMHKVHHHWKQPFTDSNYGGSLAIWDRLFGTYQQLDPDQLRYGLDRYYSNSEDENLGKLMKYPFRPTNTNQPSQTD